MSELETVEPQGPAPATGGIDVTLIRRVERTALIVGALCVAGSVASNDLRFIGGTFAGAAIGWLNLQVVRLLVDRAVRLPDERRAVMGAFAVKFVLLLTLITVVVLLTNVDLVGFLLGISSTVVAASLVPLLNPLFPGNSPPAAPPAQSEAESRRDEGE